MFFSTFWKTYEIDRHFSIPIDMSWDTLQKEILKSFEKDSKTVTIYKFSPKFQINRICDIEDGTLYMVEFI